MRVLRGEAQLELQLLPRAWSGFPLPVYPGLTPRNLLFERSGPSNDFVTIKGDL